MATILASYRNSFVRQSAQERYALQMFELKFGDVLATFKKGVDAGFPCQAETFLWRRYFPFEGGETESAYADSQFRVLRTLDPTRKKAVRGRGALRHNNCQATASLQTQTGNASTPAEPTGRCSLGMDYLSKRETIRMARASVKRRREVSQNLREFLCFPPFRFLLK